MGVTGFRYTFKDIVVRAFAAIGVLLLLEQAFKLYWYGGPQSLRSFRDGRIESSSHVNYTTVTSKRSKAIVAAATVKDNTTWMQELLPEWEANVYVTNDPEASTTVARNRGNEGSAYLSYIIEYYHNLPEHMVFIHAHRYQWHNDDLMYDHVPVLKKLNLQYLSDAGYTSLRCPWNPGCLVGMRPDLDADDGFFGTQAEYAKAFQFLFPGREIPKEVGHPCCAQFALSREHILKHPVTYYENIRQWLWDVDLPSGRSGRVMEYMWHIIFDQPAISCETAEACYCNKFNLCNLTCERDGDCNKRWWMPHWDESLPKNWPEEGQGERGWPEDGWWETQDWSKDYPP